MTDKEPTKEQVACHLCELSNGSGCTTPQPDPNHWICKAWLLRARAVEEGWDRTANTELTREQELKKDIAEIMLEVRQYLINTEFSPEPFTEPVDVDVLKVKFPKKILARVKKADWKSPEEVVEFIVSHKRSYYAKPDGTIILVTSAEWTEQEWESLIKGVAL